MDDDVAQETFEGRPAGRFWVAERIEHVSEHVS
jgi:hypothetical protein